MPNLYGKWTYLLSYLLTLHDDNVGSSFVTAETTHTHTKNNNNKKKKQDACYTGITRDAGAASRRMPIVLGTFTYCTAKVIDL